MSSKRKVTQGDLRKAMNEAKKKATTVRRIESPLAKYPFFTIIISYFRLCLHVNLYRIYFLNDRYAEYREKL